MASKSTLYRPMRITRMRANGLTILFDEVGLNPTGVQSIETCTPWHDPTTKAEVRSTRITLKDRDEGYIYVTGTVRDMIEAWDAALKGGAITPGEWGYVPTGETV